MRISESWVPLALYTPKLNAVSLRGPPIRTHIFENPKTMTVGNCSRAGFRDGSVWVGCKVQGFGLGGVRPRVLELVFGYAGSHIPCVVGFWD